MTKSVAAAASTPSEHSRFLGAMWPAEGGWPCHHWPVKAVERVTDFRAAPKHPVLLLSNVHDPITSIENSWKIMDELLPTESAGLGVRAGFGHASWSMHSTCIVNITQAYMDDWTLPAENMIPCPYDEQPFAPMVPVEGY